MNGGFFMNFPSNIFPGNPQDKLLQMSLGELLYDNDAEIHKKGNKLKVTKRTPGASIHIEYTQYDDTSVLSTNLVSHDKPVSQMQETIRQMRADGMTQQEVAEKLSTSPSNISKIEKKMRKHGNNS